jgi:hypothetical protein
VRRRLLVVALAALAAACSRAPRAERWRTEVAQAHREVDARLDAGDPAGARAMLLALVAAQTAIVTTEPAHRLALQDAYFRLSQLALAAHEPRQALADADAGLALGDAPHLFVANLLVARAAAREAAGDPRAAAADYHRALTINETLLAEALGRPRPGPRP